MDILLAFIVTGIFIFNTQLFVRGLTGIMYKSVKSCAAGLKTQEGEKLSPYIEMEIAALDAIDYKKNYLGYITSIISCIEFIFFLLAGGIVGPSLELLKISAGWLGIKALGNYQQWSGAVFGRATFYIFMIGSITNIFLATISGIIVFNFIL